MLWTQHLHKILTRSPRLPVSFLRTRSSALPNFSHSCSGSFCIPALHCDDRPANLKQMPKPKPIPDVCTQAGLTCWLHGDLNQCHHKNFPYYLPLFFPKRFPRFLPLTPLLLFPSLSFLCLLLHNSFSFQKTYRFDNIKK